MHIRKYIPTYFPSAFAGSAIRRRTSLIMQRTKVMGSTFISVALRDLTWSKSSWRTERSTFLRSVSCANRVAMSNILWSNPEL